MSDIAATKDQVQDGARVGAAINVEVELEAGLAGACDAVSAAHEERSTGELTSNTTAFEQMLPMRPVTVTVE